MTKEEKIKAIYEKIADKTLSFGCQVLDNSWWDTWYAHIITSQYDEKIWNVVECSSWRNDRLYKWLWHMDDMWKIIWHPVMIWDVLDYIYNNIYKKETQTASNFLEEHKNRKDNILSKWEFFRKPLEKQSSDCIDFVFNLLPKE